VDHCSLGILQPICIRVVPRMHDPVNVHDGSPFTSWLDDVCHFCNYFPMVRICDPCLSSHYSRLVS
jgi:hypothetical protein